MLQTRQEIINHIRKMAKRKSERIALIDKISHSVTIRTEIGGRLQNRTFIAVAHGSDTVAFPRSDHAFQ
ncbi:MAG: hypothetical protein IJY35_10890 [Clostridia bacterium]|nr:hypothetical protein [Clostridia bacterium]